VVVLDDGTQLVRFPGLHATAALGVDVLLN
jgi:hypothetical protein